MSTIAIASPADAPRLSALHAQCFDPPWAADAVRALLAGPGAFALAVRWEAFILARAVAGEAEILALATAPQARRLGHARSLVLAATAEAARLGAKEIFLEVATDNEAAIALYSGLGFGPVGRRPGYYARGPGTADALTLRAALPLVAAGNLASGRRVD